VSDTSSSTAAANRAHVRMQEFLASAREDGIRATFVDAGFRSDAERQRWIEGARRATVQLATGAALATTLAVMAPAETALAATPRPIPTLAEAAALTQKLPSIVLKMQGQEIPTLHPLERVRLCMEAAKALNLKAVGRDWKDIYAVIQAETEWAPRVGMGLNGRESHGLAQMEAETAKGLGITNPNDPSQAVLGAGMLLRDATLWTRAQGHELKDAALSVYYNLSTKARHAWDGKSVEDLPYPTRRHIEAVSQARVEAAVLGRQYEQYVKQEWPKLLLQQQQQEQQARSAVPLGQSGAAQRSLTGAASPQRDEPIGQRLSRVIQDAAQGVQKHGAQTVEGLKGLFERASTRHSERGPKVGDAGQAGPLAFQHGSNESPTQRKESAMGHDLAGAASAWLQKASAALGQQQVGMYETLASLASEPEFAGSEQDRAVFAQAGNWLPKAMQSGDSEDKATFARFRG
jgi:hypothetical protein